MICVVGSYSVISLIKKFQTRLAYLDVVCCRLPIHPHPFVAVVAAHRRLRCRNGPHQLSPSMRLKWRHSNSNNNKCTQAHTCVCVCVCSVYDSRDAATEKFELFVHTSSPTHPFGFISVFRVFFSVFVGFLICRYLFIICCAWDSSDVSRTTRCTR